jgi:hypothetical protein
MKIEISKSKLLSIQEDERIFFVQFGNLMNELNTLQKLIYFSSHATDNEIIRRGSHSQALFLVRILAGKLFEGWRLLEKNFFGTKISKTYQKRMTKLGKRRLSELKHYFGKSNIIRVIRNEFSFHYSPNASDKIKHLIDEAPESEVFEIFVSEEHGNCLYWASDVLVNVAILRAMDKSNLERAMKKLLDEILSVTRWFLEFLGDCVFVIVVAHPELIKAEVEIPNPPAIGEVDLPFFVSRES